MKIIQRLTDLISLIKASYRRLKDAPAVRIEEIDIHSKTVIIHRTGSHTIFKLPIAEVICDPDIISNLPPEQACWLGYYCGKMYTELALNQYKNASFFMRFSQCAFKISSQDRKGNIVYLDTKTNDLITESPIEICKTESIIKSFDPSQACYIGILAGKAAKKYASDKSHTKTSKPYLTLVK